jgi:hypothetical protein
VGWPLSGLPGSLLVGAAVTSFWRGAWYMMDATVFPESVAASGAASLAAGWAGFALLQYGVGPRLKVAEAPGAPLGRAATLGFAYSYGLCVVAAWRGVWLMWDAGLAAAQGWCPSPAVPHCHASGGG